jgi:hypothetical protein
MVVQAYQGGTLTNEMKSQRSGTITVQQVGRIGVIEVKILRDGFETASSNVWIEATR